MHSHHICIYIYFVFIAEIQEHTAENNNETRKELEFNL